MFFTKITFPNFTYIEIVWKDMFFSFTILNEANYLGGAGENEKIPFFRSLSPDEGCF